eukprot:366522-Chlamydomonas_euryale.AAC.23
MLRVTHLARGIRVSKGVISLERLGRVGQPGKIWTSTTQGLIAKIAPPPCFGALANGALPRLAAATEIARPRWLFSPPTQSASFSAYCTNAASTRNGITPEMPHCPPHVYNGGKKLPPLGKLVPPGRSQHAKRHDQVKHRPLVGT